MMIPAIQYRENYPSRDEAAAVLDRLSNQEGFVTGRIMPDDDHDSHVVTAYLRVDDMAGSPLPDTMKWVNLPESVLAGMGVDAEEIDALVDADEEGEENPRRAARSYPPGTILQFSGNAPTLSGFLPVEVVNWDHTKKGHYSVPGSSPVDMALVRNVRTGKEHVVPTYTLSERNPSRDFTTGYEHHDTSDLIRRLRELERKGAPRSERVPITMELQARKGTNYRDVLRHVNPRIDHTQLKKGQILVIEAETGFHQGQNFGRPSNQYEIKFTELDKRNWNVYGDLMERAGTQKIGDPRYGPVRVPLSSVLEIKGQPNPDPAAAKRQAAFLQRELRKRKVYKPYVSWDPEGGFYHVDSYPFDFYIRGSYGDWNVKWIDNGSGTPNDRPSGVFDVYFGQDLAQKIAEFRNSRKSNPDLGPYRTKSAAERAFKRSSLRFGRAKARYEKLSDGWYFSPVSGSRNPAKLQIVSYDSIEHTKQGDIIHGGKQEGVYATLPEARKALKRFRSDTGSYKFIITNYPSDSAVRNPESDAAAVYEEFHGSPSTELIEVEEDVHVHEHLATLGELRSIKVQTPRGAKLEIKFPTSGPRTWLATNEAKDQLFIKGGDQSLDLSAMGFKESDMREIMLIGTAHEVTYFTEKAMHGMEPVEYYHHLGEETGQRPVLLYDTRSQELSFAGGEYAIKPEGIVN